MILVCLILLVNIIVKLHVKSHSEKSILAATYVHQILHAEAPHQVDVDLMSQPTNSVSGDFLVLLHI